MGTVLNGKDFKAGVSGNSIIGQAASTPPLPALTTTRSLCSFDTSTYPRRCSRYLPRMSSARSVPAFTPFAGSRPLSMSARMSFSPVSPLMGRRRCGQVWGFLAAISLGAAAYFSNTFIDGVPLLVVFLCCSTFGIDGSFSNLAPYTVEVFGVRLGARSSGLGQAANGVGKILGPLSLALIAGTGKIVSPHATAAAVMPAFAFLGLAMVCVGLSFSILGVETHGMPMSVHGEPAEEEAAERPAIVL